MRGEITDEHPQQLFALIPQFAGAGLIGVEHLAIGREADDLTNIEYKVHPVPGYFNDEQGQNEYANSINKLSWPMNWPGKDGTWSGKWNGFFGQNQFNADQEAMYYIYDTWDKE